MTQHTFTFKYQKPLGTALPEPSVVFRAKPEENVYLSVLNEFDQFIGLDVVKEYVKELAHYTAMQRLRKKMGLKTPQMSYHMAFLGNPGTGKTSVARLLAKLFYSLGVLREDKFREVSRVQLVGNYVGHTAKDTLGVLDEAKGGVLFIDEAYALVRDNPNDFGMEAVETLLKYMEDHRDELIVVFAGYVEPMRKFLMSNPGLLSRIPNQVFFPDYTQMELITIAHQMAADFDYQLDADYEMELAKHCFREKQMTTFSNARFIRNRLERSIRKQNVRLAEEGFREAELNLLTKRDL
ncbi:MAG: Stage sporulation protein [Bacilli bacterium]|nr:Stage sporulation protein [Bacilli bacterium]